MVATAKDVVLQSRHDPFTHFHANTNIFKELITIPVPDIFKETIVISIPLLLDLSYDLTQTYAQYFI